MYRPATKQSPGPNTKERAFRGIVKMLPCAGCGAEGPSIVDHIYGSSKKLYKGLERVLVGHYAVLPLCITCDNVKTHGSRRAFVNMFGPPEKLWLDMLLTYDLEVPDNVFHAIAGEIK